MTIDLNNLTWGIEHELGDIDTRMGWEGFGRDPEPNLANSNGIAADPTLKENPFGAEINTPPTDSPEGQGELFHTLLNMYPYVSANNQHAGMHIHIRIPGLKDDLEVLKRIQKYIFENNHIFQVIDPVPAPVKADYPNNEDFKLAKRWYRFISMSHWTTLPINRIENQLKASTTEEFFNLEVPIEKKTGKPLFHAQPRAAVNLRQLKQTDTIEFRHFFQTLDPQVVINCCNWCREFLLAALDNYPAECLYEERYEGTQFPSFPVYQTWFEKRWMATTHSKNKRDVIRVNIQKILAGEFDSIDNSTFSHLGGLQ